jgi:hypothetical protein
VQRYPSAAPPPQSSFVGRFISSLAGVLLATASIVIAGLNGYGRGATRIEAIIWAGIGVGLALISLIGISSTLIHTGARRILAVIAYVFGLSFTVIAALGSQHGGRALNEATATALADERSRLDAAYKRADAVLSKLPETRPASVIQSELDAMLKDTRLNDCQGWLENSRLRATCVEKVEPRRKVLANAQERKRLTDELASTSRALSSLTIAKPANADADSLGRYLEALGIIVTRERLADLLNLLTVASVELAGGIALALGLGSAKRSTARYAHSSGNSSTKKKPNGSPNDCRFRNGSTERNSYTHGSSNYPRESPKNKATQRDSSDSKSPKISVKSEPNVRQNPATKEDALASLALGRSFASQDELAERFGRSKSTISEWLKEWTSEGLIPKRRKRGRCKAVGS